jgi:hypothetical protein
VNGTSPRCLAAAVRKLAQLTFAHTTVLRRDIYRAGDETPGLLVDIEGWPAYNRMGFGAVRVPNADVHGYIREMMFIAGLFAAVRII